MSQEIKFDFSKPKTEDGFEPSKYQSDIYNWAMEGAGGARVTAVAGSGKTTTLVDVSKYVNGTALFCAFNKHIQTELKERLPSYVNCRTIHAIGMAAIAKTYGSLNVDADKYKAICKPIAMKIIQDSAHLDKTAFRTSGKVANRLMKMTNMAMMTLADPTDLKAMKRMVQTYAINVPSCQLDIFSGFVPEVIEKGNKETVKGHIDFTDMIYFPASHDVNMRKNLWVMVDEAQDLSAAQLSIVLKSLKGRGRLIAVGDKLQSLYGFSGADPWAFDRIGDHVDSDLPLSVCYRCGTAVVDLAKNLVPQIEAAPNAGRGSVKHILEHGLIDKARGGDMVLCRVNSPLIKSCLKMIKAGKKAYVRGRDLMVSFISVIDDITKDTHYKWDDFLDILDERKHTLIENYISDGESTMAAVIKDLYESVETCHEMFECANETQLINEIKSLFREDPDSIVFSSIHRSKGLEADRVFIIRPDIVRLNWEGQQPWQAFQEQCCEYVAITRTKDKLFFVEDPTKPPYKVGEGIPLPPRPKNWTAS